MKVYVIRRNNNTYYKRYFENYVQFEDEIAFAEIYTKKVGAEHTMDFITRNKYRFNILPEELSVVEYNLIDETSLADYTKQVRKEVCEIIWGGFVGLNNINGNYEYKKFEDDFRKFLDQIEQGETK